MVEVLYDASWLAGYTFFIENFRIGLGAGVGSFCGNSVFEETAPFAGGFLLSTNLDYFFTELLSLSFGIEDGVYWSVKKKKSDELSKIYNRFCIRIGCAIKF